MDSEREVIIVAWSALIGAGLEHIVESDSTFRATVVGVPSDIAAARFASSRPAAAVVAGVCAPPPRGPAIRSVVERLCDTGHPVPIVAIVPDDCLYMHFVGGLVRHGVTGCLDWSSAEAEFLRCLKSATEGSSHHSPRVSRLLREHSSQKSSRGSHGASRELTPTEKDIAELLVESLSLDQIAFRLGRPKGTIQTHCKRIYTKVGVFDRVGLCRWFLTCGLHTRPSRERPGNGSEES